MSLAPKLILSQRQRLALTPQMRQALAVLRLSASALADRIEAELQANPFLRRDPAANDSGGWAGAAPDTLTAQPGLYERLLRQIGLMRLSGQVRAAAEYLAGSLREDGFLDVPLAEIAVEAGMPLAAVSAGLGALQTCDPPGVGARDLSECLALQLIDRGLEPALARRVVAHIPDFAARRWARLARTLGLPPERVQALAALLPALTARPAGAEAATAAVLRADLVAQFTDTGIVVEPGRDARPRLILDPTLTASADTDPALAEQRDRATALIAAIDQRRVTLLRIGQHLAQVQPAMFHSDPGGLRPLSRSALAQDLGLHPATVGRAVADKAIDIEGRLVPLASFFSAALGGADGRPVAASAVRGRLAALISAEPPDAPLSDACLCDMLRAEGVDIARRTVAKYRRALRLPTAARRRRRFSDRGSTMAGNRDSPAACGAGTQVSAGPADQWQ